MIDTRDLGEILGLKDPLSIVASLAHRILHSLGIYTKFYSTHGKDEHTYMIVFEKWGVIFEDAKFASSDIDTALNYCCWHALWVLLNSKPSTVTWSDIVREKEDLAKFPWQSPILWNRINSI